MQSVCLQAKSQGNSILIFDFETQRIHFHILVYQDLIDHQLKLKDFFKLLRRRGGGRVGEGKKRAKIYFSKL